MLPFPPFKLAPPITTAATAKSSRLAENWVWEPMEYTKTDSTPERAPKKEEIV